MTLEVVGNENINAMTWNKMRDLIIAKNEVGILDVFIGLEISIGSLQSWGRSWKSAGGNLELLLCACKFCLTDRLQSLALSVLACMFGEGFGPKAVVAVAALASTDPAPSEDWKHHGVALDAGERSIKNGIYRGYTAFWLGHIAIYLFQFWETGSSLAKNLWQCWISATGGMRFLRASLYPSGNVCWEAAALCVGKRQRSVISARYSAGRKENYLENPLKWKINYSRAADIAQWQILVWKLYIWSI